jgi:hypothetical protein
VTAAEWAHAARVAQLSAPPPDDAPGEESYESLADAVEHALDEAGEDVTSDARSDQRASDAAEFHAKWLEPLEEAARELLEDYEKTMDLVGVRSTRAASRLRDALVELDVRRTRG